MYTKFPRGLYLHHLLIPSTIIPLPSSIFRTHRKGVCPAASAVTIRYEHIPDLAEALTVWTRSPTSPLSSWRWIQTRSVECFACSSCGNLSSSGMSGRVESFSMSARQSRAKVATVHQPSTLIILAYNATCWKPCLEMI